MYYSVQFAIVCKQSDQPSDVTSIEYTPITFDKTHPLVKHYHLIPGTYALNDLINPELRHFHNQAINQSILEIAKNEEKDEVLLGRSLMSNPIYSYRVITLYNNPDLFTGDTTSRLSVYIRINYLNRVNCSLNDKRYNFSIELIPIAVYTGYLTHLDQCLTQAIDDAMKISLVHINEPESHASLDSMHSIEPMTAEPFTAGTHATSSHNRKYSLDVVEKMSPNAYLKAFSKEMIRILMCAKMVYGFSIEHATDNQLEQHNPMLLTDLISGLLLFLTMNHKLVIKFNPQEAPKILVQENQATVIFFLHGVYNLLHNACQYAKTMVHITIHHDETSDKLTVKVYDDGQHCMHDPFSDDRKNTSPLNKGWNGNWSVGLNLTRRIVANYNGHVQCIQVDTIPGKTFAIDINAAMLLATTHDDKHAFDNILDGEQEKRLAKDDYQITWLKYLLHGLKNLIASIPTNIATNIQNNIMALQM